jgi:hypothetical protein
LKNLKEQKDPIFENRISKLNHFLYYYITYCPFIIFTVFPSIYLIFIDRNDLTGLVIGFWVFGIIILIFNYFFKSKVPTKIKLTINSLHLFYKNGKSEQVKWENLKRFQYDDPTIDYVLTINEDNVKRTKEKNIIINNRIGDHIIKNKYLLNSPVRLEYEKMSKSYRITFMILIIILFLLIVIFIYMVMEDVNLQMIVIILLLIWVEIVISIITYKATEEKHPPKQPKPLWDPLFSEYRLPSTAEIKLIYRL